MTEPTTAPVESKAAKFSRLASSRVGKALDAIALIGNLAPKASYDYTEAQVAKIEAALLAEVAETIALFKAGGSTKKAGFDI